MAKYDLKEKVDAVIIGSGAGGGTLARELATKGMTVVLLEAGSRLDPWKDIENDAAAMIGKWIWLDPRTGSGRDQTNPVTYLCKTVGGSTTHYATAHIRFIDTEFKTKSVYGAIPGTTLMDWPLDLEEMLPYYGRAEYFTGVSGPWPRPLPPLPWNTVSLVMKMGAEKLGWKVHQGQMATNSIPFDGRPACIQAGFCMQGCRIRAHWSTLYSDIPKAEATGVCEVRPNCMAFKINLDSKGLAKSVVYFDPDMKEQEQMARIVVLSGNSIENPRLCLNNTSSLFPDGLANSSGEVGKNYMRHLTASTFVQFNKPVHFYKGSSMAGIVTEFADNDPKRGYAGGYQIEKLGLGAAFATSCQNTWGDNPAEEWQAPWGKSFMNWMENFECLCGNWIVGEDMPQATNRVTLNPDVKDQYGLPVAHIHFVDHDNDKKMRKHGWARSQEMYEAAAEVGGAKIVQVAHRGPYSATHNLGSMRMGDDPNTSVVNRYGQSHDVKNLFACDGSIFTTGGGENPTLTIVALAMREGDYIAHEAMRGNI